MSVLYEIKKVISIYANYYAATFAVIYANGTGSYLVKFSKKGKHGVDGRRLK